MGTTSPQQLSTAAPSYSTCFAKAYLHLASGPHHHLHQPLFIEVSVASLEAAAHTVSSTGVCLGLGVLELWSELLACQGPLKPRANCQERPCVGKSPLGFAW